jgi:hypothetical protein
MRKKQEMTLRTDPEFDDEEDKAVADPGSWAAAAAASVLIIATVTLTIVASGWDLSTAFAFG